MSSFKDINFGSECLQLDKFDLRNLVYDHNGEFLNPRIAIIAKSGSGKKLGNKRYIKLFKKDTMWCNYCSN